jgi:hypothetical protein
MWSQDYDNKHAVMELKLHKETVVIWFAKFREVLKRQPLGSIGGPGEYVEFDQTCITHQKHHRGAPKPGTNVRHLPTVAIIPLECRHFRIGTLSESKGHQPTGPRNASPR